MPPISCLYCFLLPEDGGGGGGGGKRHRPQEKQQRNILGCPLAPILYPKGEVCQEGQGAGGCIAVQRA